jgi:hypothetical protein
MANLSITVDSSDLRRALQIAPREIVLSINTSLRRSSVFTQRKFRQVLPVGTSGGLRRSVQYGFKSMTEVEIEPKAKHAPYIEYGTRPHWTSVKNLESWARSKCINTYAVQRRIAKHGTRPQPFLHTVLTSADQFAGDDMTKSINKTVDRVL